MNVTPNSRRDVEPEIRKALSAYASGDRPLAMALFSKNKDAFRVHDGPTNVLYYFSAACYVQDFCDLLLDAGFPVEELLTHPVFWNDVAWLAWPRVVDHVAHTQPDFLARMLTQGILPEMFAPLPLTDPESINYAGRLKFLPPLLQKELAKNARQYLDTPIQEFGLMIRRCAQSLADHHPQSFPTREELVNNLNELHRQGVNPDVLEEIIQLRLTAERKDLSNALPKSWAPSQKDRKSL